MTTFLTKILAHSRSLGARWSHDQAIEAARMAILAEVPAIEAALPAPVSTMPTQPGEHWEAGTIRRNNTEHARTAPVRALRDAASEVERQCPGHYTSAETLAAAGLPADVVARVVAAVAAAPTYATLPAWVDAPEVLAASLAAMVPDDHDPRGAGPIRPAPGWALHHLSRWPAAAGYTIQATYQGVPVARWSPDGDGLRIMAWDEEQARGRAGKAERKANHDRYLAALTAAAAAANASVIGCLIIAGGLDEYRNENGVARPEEARAALALAGWVHTPGQKGGTVLAHGATTPVGVKGLCRLWAGARLAKRFPTNAAAAAVWAAATRGRPVDAETVVRHRKSVTYAITAMGGVGIDLDRTVTEMGHTRPAREDDEEADLDTAATIRLTMWGAPIASWPVIVKEDGNVLTA